MGQNPLFRSRLSILGQPPSAPTEQPGLWPLVESAEKDLGLNLSGRSYAAPAMINRRERLAKNGEIDQALSAFAEAKALSPNLKIPAHSWNELCWHGSLWQRAADVIKACEQAVNQAPDNGTYRDSRGLAHALTGDKSGAIKDFQAYVEWGEENSAYKESLAERRQWIKQLQEAENPFTPATLKALRN